MVDNLPTVPPESTLPVASSIATKQLSDNAHAGASVIYDQTGDRAKGLGVNSSNQALVRAAELEAALALLGTQVTSAAILAKLTSDPATQTTLAAVLAAVDTIEALIAAQADITETQPVSLASVPSHAVTGPLTDAQLRAATVPVSGTVAVTGPLTDTQLRASAVPVSVSGVATEATLALIEASVDAVFGAVDGLEGKDFATQTTLAAVLAKIIAAPSTEAKQDTIITALQLIDNIVSGAGVNISQVNGVAPLMGAGNTGTGSPRVTIASDQAAVAVTPAGNVAHDAADSGNPVKIGGIARQANPTAVAALDRTDAMFDDLGRQVVVVGHVRDLVGTQHVQIASSAAETTIITAGGAGVLNDISSLVITNQTATPVNVTIKDDTAGTTRAIIALAANGGAVIPYPVALPQAVANKPWTATLSSAAVTVNFHSVFLKNV